MTGPECSGKTTLSQGLVSHLQGILVPEVSRSILTLTQNEYFFEDLLTIAKYQSCLESIAAIDPDRWIICDTSMLVLQIWSQYRFQKVHSYIQTSFSQSNPVLWLLCRPLDHWEDDGLRVDQHQRDELFELYRTALLHAEKPFLIVPAQPTGERLRWVLDHTSELLKY